MPLMRSFRVQLTALYLAFFSMLFILFSIFLHGELSRSLTARLDETLANEADSAVRIFPEELAETHGDAVDSAREVVSELKVRGHFITIREGDHVLTPKPQYIDAMTNWEDPLYRKIVQSLPAGTKPSDYITSLDVVARKPQP